MPEPYVSRVCRRSLHKVNTYKGGRVCRSESTELISIGLADLIVSSFFVAKTW
jgi:hypothetical protein